jgi:hypothetical protein
MSRNFTCGLAGADVENLLLNCLSGIALAQKIAVLIPVGGEFLLTQRLSARKTWSNGSGTVDFDHFPAMAPP